MARAFNGSTQRLEASFSIALPLTIAAWFRSPDVTGNYNAVSVGTAGGSDQSRCVLHIRGTGDAVSARSIASGGSAAQAVSGPLLPYTANAWYHGCATFTSTTQRNAFIGGANKGSNTNTIALGTVTKVTIGAAETTTGNYAEYFPGNLANVGIWNVVLTDAEIAELATGVGCNTVRPDALVAWYRLLDSDNDVDWWGQNNLTATGSPTYTQHPPPIHYASGTRVFIPQITAPTLADLAVGGQTFSGIVPSIRKNAAAAAGSFVLTGNTPTTRKIATTPIGTATLTGVALTTRKSIDLAAGALNLTGVALEADKLADLAVGDLAIAGVALTAPAAAAVDVGAATLTGVALTTRKSIDLAAGALNLAGVALEADKLADLAVGDLAIAGVALTATAASTVAVGTVTLAGVALEADKLADLAVGDLAIDGVALTIKHAAGLAVGNLEIAAAPRNAIQEFRFNGATTGTVVVSTTSAQPFTPATTLFQIQNAASWDTAFGDPTSNVVTPVAGGFRVEFTGTTQANRPVDLYTVDVDGTGLVTVANIRTGRGYPIDARKLAGLDAGAITLDGVALEADKLVDLAAGVLQIDGVAFTTEHAAGLAVGLVTLAGVALAADQSADLAVGTVTLAGLTPSDLTFVAVTPGQLQITGVAPAAFRYFAATATFAGCLTLRPALYGNVELEPTLAGCLALRPALYGNVALAPTLAATITIGPTFSGVLELTYMTCEGDLRFGDLLIDNTIDVKIVGLKAAGVFVNDATCVMTLTKDGTPIDGASGLSMPYNATPGEYLGRLPHTLDLEEGEQYRLTATATKAGVAVGSWAADLEAVIRPASYQS